MADLTGSSRIVRKCCRTGHSAQIPLSRPDGVRFLQPWPVLLARHLLLFLLLKYPVRPLYDPAASSCSNAARSAECILIPCTCPEYGYALFPPEPLRSSGRQAPAPPGSLYPVLG